MFHVKFIAKITQIIRGLAELIWWRGAFCFGSGCLGSDLATWNNC